ncbi:MAG: tetratricopeptide repeat protein, partial [Verrucomicrobia bacterium]|nr:tetratricopeptide repeat protein [Verrucomicrobiota bacterium]
MTSIVTSARRFLRRRNYLVAAFSLALLIRLIYLAESADNPTFRAPIVDSQAYHELAVRIAGGWAGGDELFWQPVFYPFFLGRVYRVFGPCPTCARVLQAALGAISCVLAALAARFIFTRREGWLTGLMLALYGPLIFFETELIGEGWAVFWSTALLLLLVLAARRPAPLLLATASVCAAGATLTRPPLLVWCAVALLGLIIRLWQREERVDAFAGSIMVTVPFAIILCLLASFNRQQTGHYGVLPHSAGINLYVGNNPDWIGTITARPGLAWEALSRESVEAGITNVWEASTFFRGRALAYARQQTRSFVTGLAWKALRFVNGRELPRNVDLYLFRKWSLVLRCLVWKAGGFGMPFGLLLPLSLLGLLLHRRRIPWPVWSFLLTYPVVIVLYFVSARYRVVAVPFLVVPAAAGVTSMASLVRNRLWSRLVPALLFLLAVGSLFAWPRSFAEERTDYEAEMYRALGRVHYQSGRLEDARASLERALALAPDMAEALIDMGNVMADLGDKHEALALARQALAANPGHPGYLYNVGTLLLELGDIPQAERRLRAAVEGDAANLNARVNLAVCLLRLNRPAEARAEAEAVLAASPGHARALE